MLELCKDEVENFSACVKKSAQQAYIKIETLRGNTSDVRLIFSTTVLLGRSRSDAPFWGVLSISVALSLGAVLRLSNITPGGSETRMVGRNTRCKRDNKKTLKTLLSAVLSHLRIFYQ